MTETIKNTLDATLFGGSALTWIITAGIPLVVGGLTVVWAIYRLYDIHLSVKLKQKLLEK